MRKIIISISTVFFILILAVIITLPIFNPPTARSADLEMTQKMARPDLVLPVPFTPQAPLAEWADERQEDGCEEAAVLMGMAWVKKEINFDKYEWRARIVKLADWEQKKYGENRDVSLFNILVWIFGDYFAHGNVAIKSVRNASDILTELEQGHLVITPMNGRTLNNPYFTPPGPERHMVLIKGYDYVTAEFITNDPGTRRGENYRYPEEVIFNAIRPYQTGFHEPFGAPTKEMIVVGR